MRICHVTSELAPLAKVGGLADVVYGLSQATAALGHSVSIILPKYPWIDLAGHYDEQLGVYRNLWRGVHLILIPDPAFEREGIYGHSDDLQRFLRFCARALPCIASLSPDWVHVHDWPTSWLTTQIRPSMLTIHSLEHQGIAAITDFVRCGLTPPPSLNLLETGVMNADIVTTVSPSYAEEIQTPMGGHGLDRVIHAHRDKLFGILNGVDTDLYNPETDPHIAAHFSSKSPLSDVLRAKSLCRQALFGTLREVPLIGSVTRLVRQKAPHLIVHGIEKTLALGGQFVLLGSINDPDFAEMFQRLQKEFASHPDVLLFLDHDEGTARKIFAACDALLVPSLFEPCGLTQMIAMRYGTLPLVRRTGGLGDTVQEGYHGWTFQDPDPGGVDWVLERAFDCYHHHRSQWYQMMAHVLSTSVGWERSARKYEELYRRKLAFK